MLGREVIVLLQSRYPLRDILTTVSPVSTLDLVGVRAVSRSPFTSTDAPVGKVLNCNKATCDKPFCKSKRYPIAQPMQIITPTTVASAIAPYVKKRTAVCLRRRATTESIFLGSGDVFLAIVIYLLISIILNKRRHIFKHLRFANITVKILDKKRKRGIWG